MGETRLLGLAIAFVLAAGLVGCGGDDTNAASPEGGADATLGDGGGTGDGTTGDGGGRTDGPVGLPEGGPFNPDSGGSCLNLGGGCTIGADCCSGTCTLGVCTFPACLSDGRSCTNNLQCCSGICGAGGTCSPLNTSCKTLGNGCSTGAECCSGSCMGGMCSPSSFCNQTGDVCGSGVDCCSGLCNIPPGQLFGTCAPPPTGPANCGMPDGTVCGGLTDAGVVGEAGLPPCGGACCSRLCAPYGPTGFLVCQPASGCHVVGDLCMQDSDCCYDAPGSCDITPPSPLGICRNAMGCQPNGDVCKLQTMSCNARCACCSGNCETMDTCRPDNVGVPRCAAAQCVDGGAQCASSADCCNGMPCVPNPSDAGPPFVCYTGSCVPSCGACTISADCCPGETCIVGQGSTMGICGPCGGPGSDAGTGDGGGPPPSDSGPPPADTGVCATYGQTCTMNSDCCNGVPCSNGTGPCLAGQVGCTCHFPVQ